MLRATPTSPEQGPARVAPSQPSTLAEGVEYYAGQGTPAARQSAPVTGRVPCSFVSASIFPVAFTPKQDFLRYNVPRWPWAGRVARRRRAAARLAARTGMVEGTDLTPGPIRRRQHRATPPTERIRRRIRPTIAVAGRWRHAVVIGRRRGCIVLRRRLLGCDGKLKRGEQPNPENARPHASQRDWLLVADPHGLVCFPAEESALFVR